MKLKNIFLVLILTIAFVSCKKDDDTPHDPVAQAKTDDEKLIDYFKSHYYKSISDKLFGEIDSIKDQVGVTSLFNDTRLNKKNIKYNDINYTLYYLKINEGVTVSPTKYDSVFLRYKGYQLDGKTFGGVESYALSAWHDLNDRIEGWRQLVPEFKSGINTTNVEEGGPLEFSNNGYGVLFIPSGLAYGERGTQTGSLANENLVFHIDLAQVVKADNDNDGILNMYEDLDNDGSLRNDNTDEDRFPNYFDVDDDGDGKLTKDENPDPNGDGNPNDAKDTDNDGIPDYLDSDTN